MQFNTFISLLLVFLCNLNISHGRQVALRPRPKNPVLSRSIASDGSIFDPINEDSFYVVGEDPNTVIKTIHHASKRKFVNFEKFENYLRPQERLCTPSPDNETSVLSFPLNQEHYLAACERWAEDMKLVFIGHDPSCYAPEEERSAFKSLSIAFDDASQTIRVTGKALHFGDKHFPAPTELVVGRAPRDVILTRRTTSEKGIDVPDPGDIIDELTHCLSHIEDCGDEFLEKVTANIDISAEHINFTSENNEAHKKYWPPDEMTKKTGVPELFELYCLECRTSGGMDMEFHVIFNTKGDEKDDKHNHIRRNADSAGDVRQDFKDHVQRAFVKYRVTDDIKIRKQLEVVSPVSVDIYCTVPIWTTGPAPALVPQCSLAASYTAGGLQWEPATAKEKKDGRGNALGPKEVGDWKKGRGAAAWGYAIWPVDLGLYAGMNIGVGSKINVTLPGFEATIPVGSEFEIDLMGDGTKSPIVHNTVDPVIELLPPDLDIESSDIHFVVGIGPKAAINIGLPLGGLGIGAGIKLDLIRFDSKLSEYQNVSSDCVTATGNDKAIEKAFGFTLDMKSGLYAFLDIGGFYIGTDWIGNKMPGSPYGGLYWGIKNLVAKCGDCGKKGCVSKRVDKILDATFEALGFGHGKKFQFSKLAESSHVGIDGNNSISKLDGQMAGEAMPSGNPNTSCYPKGTAPKFQRDLFDMFQRDLLEEKKDNPCQPR